MTTDKNRSALDAINSRLNVYGNKLLNEVSTEETKNELRFAIEALDMVKREVEALTPPAVAILDQKDMPNEIRAWGDGTWKDSSCDNAIVASLTSVYELKKAVAAQGVTDATLALAIDNVRSYVDSQFYINGTIINAIDYIIKAAAAPKHCAGKGKLCQKKPKAFTPNHIKKSCKRN